MKLATTTMDFPRLGNRERVAHVCAAGFRHLDMSLYEPPAMREFMAGDWEYKANALREYAASLGADFVQAHSPGGNALSPTGQAELLEATVRSVEVCGVLGVPCTVVHAGHGEGISREAMLQGNRAFYEKLYPVMEKTGVMVLVENAVPDNRERDIALYTGEDLREFRDFLGHPLIGTCWDVGHGNIKGAQYADIAALGDRLTAVHFNDNHGVLDEHLLPYMGTVNNDEVMTALLAIGFKGPLTLEALSPLIDADHWAVHRRSFEGSCRAREIPEKAWDQTEQLRYTVGRHILECYDCFEE